MKSQIEYGPNRKWIQGSIFHCIIWTLLWTKGTKWRIVDIQYFCQFVLSSFVHQSTFDLVLSSQVQVGGACYHLH